MSRIVVLAVLAACAASPGRHTLDDGRIVTYESGPPNCFERCSATRSGLSCERVCEQGLIRERVEPSCATRCAGAESQAQCIAECEQPPWICGTTPRKQSHSSSVVMTTLAVIGFSLVGVLAADYALDR